MYVSSAAASERDKKQAFQFRLEGLLAGVTPDREANRSSGNKKAIQWQKVWPYFLSKLSSC